MGDAASLLHGLVSGAVLDHLVSFDELIALHTLMVHSEIDVDSSARLVDLSDTEADPETVLGKAEFACLIIDPLLDLFLETGNIAPRTR